MADKTTPNAATATATAPSTGEMPQAQSTVASRATPRTVTLPVLPLAIVCAVIVAVIFFGGGVAVGFVIGDHPARTGTFQPFNPGRYGTQGGPNIGPKGGQDGGQRPNNHPAPAPTNG